VILPDNITLKVPATSANLGPGFDLFGLALQAYSTFQISFQYENKFEIFDLNNRQKIDIPEKSNLVRKAFLRTLGKRESPGMQMLYTSDLPTSSGFGSSASALVAGVAAGSYFLKKNQSAALSLQEELEILTELEGHPDNVCPARLGGFIFSSLQSDGKIRYIKKSLPQDLGLAVIIPHYRVSTKKSRSKLPKKYGMNDIISNLKGTIHWMEYLNTGNQDDLLQAIHLDRIHEPYRSKNIPGYFKLQKSLKDLGCHGTTISGSGPGILVYFPQNIKNELIHNIKSIVNRDLQLNQNTDSVKFTEPDYTGLIINENLPAAASCEN